MNHEPVTRPRRRGPLAAAALALACVLGVTVWWSQRAAAERRLQDALAAYADVPLPERGDPVDGGLAALGADLFEAHCSACHAVTGEPKLGPNLAGVTEQRDPAWIRSMILRPDSMTRDDPIARALKASYQVQMMVVGRVGPTDARAILEFLRRVDAQAGG